MASADPSAAARFLATLLTTPRRGPALDDTLLAAAVAHGVMPLLCRSLAAHGALERLPPAQAGRIRTAAVEAVVLDALATDAMRRMAAALDAAAIRPVIFKGAALATTHYPASWLRPRGDVDLLVPDSQVSATFRALEAIGYRKMPRPEGEHVTFQARFACPPPSVDFACDVHWRLADPQAFAGLFSYDELMNEAVAGEGPGIWFPGSVHALLIAAAHRAAHHYDGDRLLLLYDVDLIARRLSPADWGRVTAIAEARQLRAVCLRALDLTAALFQTPVPAAVIGRLARSGGPPEPTARYVGATMRRVDIMRSDLERLDSWQARAALVREHLFPPRGYMEAQYGPVHPALMPFLYVDRIVRGAGSWFRPLR